MPQLTGHVQYKRHSEIANVMAYDNLSYFETKALVIREEKKAYILLFRKRPWRIFHFWRLRQKKLKGVRGWLTPLPSICRERATENNGLYSKTVAKKLRQMYRRWWNVFRTRMIWIFWFPDYTTQLVYIIRFQILKIINLSYYMIYYFYIIYMAITVNNECLGLVQWNARSILLRYDEIAKQSSQ